LSGFTPLEESRFDLSGTGRIGNFNGDNYGRYFKHRRAEAGSGW
jgi:hypothetical protein